MVWKVIVQFLFEYIHPFGGSLQKHVVSIVTITSVNHNIRNLPKHVVEVENILNPSRSVVNPSPHKAFNILYSPLEESNKTINYHSIWS